MVQYDSTVYHVPLIFSYLGIAKRQSLSRSNMFRHRPVARKAFVCGQSKWGKCCCLTTSNANNMPSYAESIQDNHAKVKDPKRLRRQYDCDRLCESRTAAVALGLDGVSILKWHTSEQSSMSQLLCDFRNTCPRWPVWACYGRFPVDEGPSKKSKPWHSSQRFWIWNSLILSCFDDWFRFSPLSHVHRWCCLPVPTHPPKHQTHRQAAGPFGVTAASWLQFRTAAGQCFQV